MYLDDSVIPSSTLHLMPWLPYAAYPRRTILLPVSRTGVGVWWASPCRRAYGDLGSEALSASRNDWRGREDEILPHGGPLTVPASSASVGKNGVRIDSRGQLKIASAVNAQKRCQTALVITGAFSSLTRADFTRLAPPIVQGDISFLEGTFCYQTPFRERRSD